MDKDKLEKKIKEEEEKYTRLRKPLDEFDEYQKAAQENNTARAANQTEIEEKEQELRLKNARDYAERRVVIAKKYSQEELDSKIALNNQELALKLNGIDPEHQGERALAITQAQEKEKEIRAAFATDQLNRDKELLAYQLAYIKADLPKRLELTRETIEDERRIKVLAAKDDAGMILQINKDAAEKDRQAQRDSAYQIASEKLKIAQMGIQGKISSSVPGTSGQLEAQKELVENQRQIEILSANYSITNEQEKQAKLIAIDQEAAQKKKKLQEDADKSELADQMKMMERLQKQNELDINKDNPDLTKGGAEKAAQIELKSQIQLDKDKLALLEAYADESIAKEQEVADTILSIKKDLLDKTNALKKKEQEFAEEVEKQVADFMLNTAKDITSAVFENQKTARENSLQGTMDHLNADKQAELSNKALTEEQKMAIDRKYKAEESAAKLAAWKADQKAKEEQALINGALAFTMSLAQQGYPAGLVTGALAMLSAGVQAGIIASQSPPKFAKGVIGLQGPGTATSDSIHAMLSAGESVMTAEETKNYRPALEAMRQGSFMDSYIPMSDINAMLNGVGVHVQGTDTGELVSEIRGLRSDIKSKKEVNISMDEHGFTKHITHGSTRTQYYNSRYKF